MESCRVEMYVANMRGKEVNVLCKIIRTT